MKISRSFSSSTTFKLHIKRHSIKLHVIFFSKTIVFPKTTIFIKFVVLLTIVNDNPSLTIVNKDHSLTIVNIIVNKIYSFKNGRFSKVIFLKKSYKKTVTNRFLKNDHFLKRSLFFF